MPAIKTIAGAAGAVGVLAFIAASMGGEPETVEPVAASITAPLSEQPKVPPASTQIPRSGRRHPPLRPQKPWRQRP